MEESQIILDEKKKYNIRGIIFLGLIGGLSTVYGFSRGFVKAKRSESKLIEQRARHNLLLIDEGSVLAMKALGWGTLYAVLGTGAFCFSVWKLSGARNMEEFRLKAGQVLPRLSNDKPPTSRTEFDGLTDLMKYVATWGKE